MKPCFDLFADKPQTQTNTTNISGTCVARKESNQAWEKLYHKQRW